MTEKAFNLAAPNLPIAPDKYDHRYFDQLNNVFRLFFNTLVNSINTEQIEDFTYEDTVYTVQQLFDLANVDINTHAFVTDATVTTFASVPVGGGTNKVPVYYDGTTWRIG